LDEISVTFNSVPDITEAQNAYNFRQISPTTVLNFEMNRPGAFGNSRQISIVRSTDTNFAIPLAQWDGNILRITVPNSPDVDIELIQATIDLAARGRPNFEIRVTGAGGATTGTINTTEMNATRNLNMAGGQDSFFQRAFESLTTMRLDGGAFQTPQTAADVKLFVAEDGVIYAYHSQHGMLLLGRVDVVEFVNPEGLQQVGTSYFIETQASGPPQVKIPRDDTDTKVCSGALEMSNVDLSNEFSDMIITQRGFQANSRIITVSDSMLEELVNLKR